MPSKRDDRKREAEPLPEPSEEARFLAEYRAQDFPRPSVTVDVVILTIVDTNLEVLLVQRDTHPFKGSWALPGGFVRVGDTPGDRGEDLDAAAERVLSAKTKLPHGSIYLEQLYTFGRADRDPRMRVITVAYYALVRPDLVPFVTIGAGATGARWTPTARLGELALAFDHAEIVRMALDRIQGKIDYSNIAFQLVPETFTIPELRSVHEVIKGTAYDPGNFRRRFHRMLTDAIIERAPGKRITASRPAQVFRFRREE